jgi:hypothetical protein
MKRILAWIGIVAILAAYVVAVVFAIRGGDLAVPVTMSCILGVAYLSFYFHIGKMFADILKRHKQKKEEEENQNHE